MHSAKLFPHQTPLKYEQTFVQPVAQFAVNYIIAIFHYPAYIYTSATFQSYYTCVSNNLKTPHRKPYT